MKLLDDLVRSRKRPQGEQMATFRTPKWTTACYRCASHDPTPDRMWADEQSEHVQRTVWHGPMNTIERLRGRDRLSRSGNFARQCVFEDV